MSTKAEIPSLTGLRGLAALLVVFSHYSVWCAPWKAGTAPPSLFWIFGTGSYGMTLFFTLSGFVIAYNYVDLDWRGHPIDSIARFVYLRFTRLYPALLVFFAFVAISHAHEMPEGVWFKWLLIHIASIETWIPARVAGNLPVNGTFSISWSISTEFLMYLMFSAAMIIAVAVRPVLAMLCGGIYIAAIIVISLYLTNENPLPIPVAFEDFDLNTWNRWFFYSSPYYRFLEFSMGAAAAILNLRYAALLKNFRRELSFCATLAATSLIAVFVMAQSPLGLMSASSPLLQTASAGLFAVIFLNSTDDSKLNRALSSSWLIWVGTISYSLYLFHPIAPRAGVYVGDPFNTASLGTFAANFAMTMGMALILAYGMYRMVEVPARNWLRRAWIRRPDHPHEDELVANVPASGHEPISAS